MFGSLKSLKACTAHISYWLICQETRNEVGVNAPRLSVLGLFDFRKMTYTPRRREYLNSLRLKISVLTLVVLNNVSLKSDLVILVDMCSFNAGTVRACTLRCKHLSEMYMPFIFHSNKCSWGFLDTVLHYI